MTDRFIVWLAASEHIDPGSLGVPVVKDANSVLTNVLNTVYFWAGIVCVIVIIIGAYLYTTSAGDPSQTKRGKNAVLGASIGVVIVMLAFTITQFAIGSLK